MKNPSVGDGEGEPPRIIGRDGKYSLDERRVTLNVRNHDQDVAGVNIGVIMKEGEERVLQDFNFPKGL